MQLRIDRPEVGQDQGCFYWASLITVLMVLSGTTKLVVSSLKIKGKRGKVTVYTRFLIHIPSAMARDSQFPFRAGQELVITVDPKGKIVLSG